jgi:hypothetical protein
MSRFDRWVLTSVVVLAIPGRHAAAQFNFMGPGSTVQGDILRGDGAAAYGWGACNHLSALGRAIDADTLLRLGTAWAQAEAENDRHRVAHLAWRKERIRLALDARQSRFRSSPSDSDVTRGDALNTLARELTGPAFGLSTLRTAPVRVPDGILGRLPLHLARAGVTIAPVWLRIEEGWPTSLQAPAFASVRQAFESSVDTIFDQATRGRLSRHSVVAIDHAVGDLRSELEAAAAADPSGDWASARACLTRLERAARVLHDPAGAAAFSAVLGKGVTTVAGLLELMRRHHLQFGAAQTPDDAERYRELYARLVEQRSLLMGQNRETRLGSRIAGPGRGPHVAMDGNAVRERVKGIVETSGLPFVEDGPWRRGG